MKLRLPGDFQGGIMIFVLLLGITIVELYFVKKAYRSTVSGGSAQQRCNAAGGDWHPNEDTNDPCCLLPKGVSHSEIDVPKCEGKLDQTSYCPEVCWNEPSSAMCKGMCTGMKG